jgi:phosphatidylglycerol:prolipoprotein diacylglycerol transferase
VAHTSPSLEYPDAPPLCELIDFAWPGALLGGLLVSWLWARAHHSKIAALTDVAALALPLPQALACAGLLLSGNVLGRPTDLPWGIDLFGAVRHPTQLYYLIASLVCFGVLLHFRRQRPRPGWLSTAYIGIQGLAWLLIEPLRADSLIVLDGVRVTQALGLLFLMTALFQGRRISENVAAEVPSAASQ